MKGDKKSEEIFDPSWLYGEEHIQSPETRSAQKALDKILDLQKIKGLRIIITLKSIDALEEIKTIIREKNNQLLATMKEPIILSNFLENDNFQFYKENMKTFLKNNNYLEFFEEFPDSLFPLNEQIIRYIHACSQGNPREIIKFLIKIFNEIIFSDDNLESIISYYENQC